MAASVQFSPKTKVSLSSLLTKAAPDSVFSSNLFGKRAVRSDLAQHYINCALEARKTPEGVLGPIRWAFAEYLPKVLTCQRMNQPHVAYTDSGVERVKRCAAGCLGATLCAPCAAAELFIADRQAKILVGPSPQKIL